MFADVKSHRPTLDHPGEMQQMTDPANEPTRQPLPTARDVWALASRPAHTIAHPVWREARETVLALVAAGPAMIVVLGPPGTGKTALLRDLAATFGEQGRSACLLDFGDSPFDVGPVEIVLVDEADRMSATRLDELRSRGDLAIILATLPSNRTRFAPYSDLTVVHLSPLSPDAACAFVVERLAQLGLPKGCLTEAAWTQLIASGRGVPRLLLVLLGLALFVAREEQAERVTDAHVEEAVEAKGDSSDAVVEPGYTEANPTLWSIDETTFDEEDTSTETEWDRISETTFNEEGTTTEPELDWISRPPPHRRRNRAAAAAFAVVYLVAMATLLAWSHRLMNERTASAPDASKVVQTASVADHGLPQETNSSVKDATAPAVIPSAILVPKVTTASAQPGPASSASTASFQQQPATMSRLPTVAVATQPFGASALPQTWVPVHPLRCRDGIWTRGTCRAHHRRVVWYRVRRCFVALGNLCLGASYHYVRVR